MGILRKSNTYVGLDTFDIYYQDREPTSLMFQIFDLPETFPGGKTAFRINGSPYLKVGTEIKVEILDEERNVIYTEYPKYLEGSSRLVSVYIYPDALYGAATLTIVGEAAFTPDPSDLNEPIYISRRYNKVPFDWRGVYNVRWSRQILVDPKLRNDSKIRFYVPPKVDAQELYTPYLLRTYTTSSNPEYISYSTGKIAGRVAGSDYTLTLTGGGSFRREMIGAELSVNSPSGYQQSYTTKIKDVINSTSALAKTPYQNTASLPYVPRYLKSRETAQEEALGIPTTTMYQTFGDSDYTIRYESEPTYSETQDYKSFARIHINDMDTFSGDVYTVKLFMKYVGSNRGYEPIGDIILESQDLMIDSASANLDTRYGYFYTQDTIDTYWTSSRQGTDTPVTLTHNSLKMLDTMYINGADTRGVRNYDIIHTNSQSIDFDSNTEYLFEASFYAKQQLKTLDTGKTSREAVIHVFASGTAFSDTSGLSKHLANRGKLITTLEAKNLGSGITEKRFGEIDQGFFPDRSGNGKILFVIESGDWYISNISVAAAQETGFSPGSVIFKIPINDWHRIQKAQFKAEFYNQKGDRADLVVTSSEETFQGSNFFLQGTDNVLTGSMFIGNAIGEGIEMAGVRSAYIRNIGYLGYYSASRQEAPGGFLIWSGSVLPDINPGLYAGVGIELHGTKIPSGSDRLHAMRFRTDTGRFEITGSIYATDGYFSGSIEANQIKVPLGGIPADPHAFYDVDTGNYYRAAITQIGYAHFMSGSIGGWQIQPTGKLMAPGNTFMLSGSGVISASNFYVNEAGGLTASDAYIKGDVTATRIIATGSGIIGGFAITETAISTSDNSLVLKVAPNGEGQITASNALLYGTIVAGTGSIGGWSITHEGLFSDTVEINSSTNTIQVSQSANDYVKMYYTDADNWGLQGVNGGTQVYHLGSTNSIGGWWFGETQITASNIIIDSAGNLQTSNYVSGLRGWRITSDFNGFGEFENVVIRGTLRTTVFEKETVNAVGGQLWVANSTVISGSDVSDTPGQATYATWSVENAAGWARGEVIKVKKVTDTGFTTEYVVVDSSSRLDPASSTDFRGNLYVTRSWNSDEQWYFGQLADPSGDSILGDSGSGAYEYERGQVIVSTGLSQSGYIRLNANPRDPYTPYIDIVERTGSGVYDLDLKVRLGDLSGLSPGLLFGDVSPGFGLYTENVYLEGKITATSGAFTGKVHAGDLIIGSGIPVSAEYGGASTEGIYINDYNYWYDDGQFMLGGANNNVKWDNSVLQISGTLNAIDGTIGGFTITETAISSSNDRLILRSNGQITASDAYLAGTIIAGTGSIGGFTITTNAISSSNGNLVLKSNGQITASNVSMSGTIVAESGEIGGFSISQDALYSGDQGVPTFFISGSAKAGGTLKEAIFISSSNFKVGYNGTISASAGLIGDWRIGANYGELFGLNDDAGYYAKIELNPSQSAIRFISQSADRLTDHIILEISQSKSTVILNPVAGSGSAVLDVTRFKGDRTWWDEIQFYNRWNSDDTAAPGHWINYNYYKEFDGQVQNLTERQISAAVYAYSYHYNGDTTYTPGAGDVGNAYTGSNIHSAVAGYNGRGLSGGLKVGVYGSCNDHFESVGVLAEGSPKDARAGDPGSSAWAFVARFRPSCFGNPWTGSISPTSAGSNFQGIASADDTHCTMMIFPTEFDTYNNWNQAYRNLNGEALQGRIGIGCWVPQGRLDVRGTITGSKIQAVDMGVTSSLSFLAGSQILGDIYMAADASIGVGTDPSGLSQTLILREGSNASAHESIYLQNDGGTSDDTAVDIVFKNSNNTVISQLYGGGYIRVSRQSGWGDFMWYSSNGSSETMRLWIDGSSGNVGIGTSSWTGTFALYVAGNIGASGNITALTSSDKKLKKNISQLKDPLKKIIEIRGVEFDWDKKDSDIPHEDGKHDVGIIAQEVEKVLPEAVTVTGDGYKALHYEKLIPLLVEAIKEQNIRIDKLETRIKDLEDGNRIK